MYPRPTELSILSKIKSLGPC